MVPLDRKINDATKVITSKMNLDSSKFNVIEENKLIKVGNFVQCHIAFLLKEQLPAWTFLGTVPDEFKPITDIRVRGTAYNDDIFQFRVRTDGQVQIENFPLTHTNNYCCTFVYLAQI